MLEKEGYGSQTRQGSPWDTLMVPTRDESQTANDKSEYYAKLFEVVKTSYDGVKKPQLDFLEDGKYKELMIESLSTIFSESPDTPSAKQALNLLTTFKRAGANIFSSFSCIASAIESSTLSFAYDGDESRIRAIVNMMAEHNLIDDDSYDSLAGQLLSGENVCYRHNGDCELFIDHVMQKVVDMRVQSKSDDPAVKYWSELSLKSGKNMMMQLIYGGDTEGFCCGFPSLDDEDMAKKRQNEFDFTEPAVMKLFINQFQPVDSDQDTLVTLYQSPGFRSGLRQESSQQLILERLFRRSVTDDGSFQLFGALAQSRSILEDMHRRGVFDHYSEYFPRFFSVIGGATARIINNNYSEKDRILYAAFGSRYSAVDVAKAELFDADGNPKKDFWWDMIQYKGWKHQSYLGFVQNQDEETKAEMGFTPSEWDFIKSLDIVVESKIAQWILIDQELELIDTYFDANGPKPEFWQDSLDYERDYEFLSNLDEETKAKTGFDETTIAFLNSYDLVHGSRLVQNNDIEEILKYFDPKGPKPEFWHECFRKNDFETASRFKQFTDAVIFDERHTAALEEYNNIEDRDLKGVFQSFIASRIDSIPLEAIGYVSSVLNELHLSNAEEISGHCEEFADAILSSVGDDEQSEIKDNIEKRIRELENIFTKNNLPYVGKVYHCFRVLHPIGYKSHRAKRRLKEPLRERLERGAFKGRAEAPLRADSPPQTMGEYRRIIESKDSVIFSDLLKSFLGSNNRDLRQYLGGLKTGAKLTERIMNGETDFSENEQEDLRIYRNHLSAIYENLQASKKEPFVSTEDIISDMRTLGGKFSPLGRAKIPDRVVQNFGYMLGIRSCDEALNRIDSAAMNADTRNREAAKRGQFKLESGDLIKSLGVEYLGKSLQNGFLCKEFLDGQAQSDSTPLDADINVLPEGLSGNISEGVDVKNAKGAFGAMSCMVVMKGDNNSGLARFMAESDNGEYDRDKYEVWHNGGINYGIRVGFPSTEVDYIVHDRQGRENGFGDDLKRIKYEVVKNGFYIPIVDKESGELVFTPDEYDNMRYKLSGLDTFNGGKFLRADSEERHLVPSLSLDSYTFPDGTTIEGSSEIVSKSQNNKDEVDKKRKAIIGEVIDPVLQRFTLTRKDFIDGDLTEGSVEIVDTGSTGRYSNALGDGDFDFIMKLDKRIIVNPEVMRRIRMSFCDALGVSYGQTIKDGNVRAKNIKLPSLDEPVDIDITFNTKTNKVRYSTEEALKEFYSSMSDADREEVVANVVFAKQFLKKAEAYKPNRGDKPQGGLGGVGIENWILQNGGSFIAAAKGFMEAADECGENFGTFKSKYAIIDFGENHQGEGWNDNFVVRNMTKEGYVKMKQALRTYLEQFEMKITRL